MRRWLVAFALVLLATLPIVFSHARNPELLQDTDTAVLLSMIRERKDPASWFAGDWPLQNHFYRPISTLTFELDNAIYGSDAGGFGRTNAILAALSILALFWVLRELSEAPWMSAAGALLFASWHLRWTDTGVFAAHILVGLSLACFLLPGRRLAPAISAALVWWFVGAELVGMQDLKGRILDWLPGRTATCMTLFALLSMASYARFERLSADRLSEPDPTPLEPPATKGTVPRGFVPKRLWMWPILSSLSLLLALGSYEQAVMAPAALVGVGLVLRWKRYRVRWTWHVLFWALLGGYLSLRGLLVSTDVSGYQAQQFRSGSGVLFSLLAYALPAAQGIWTLGHSLDVGAAIWLTGQPWSFLAGLSANVAALAEARKDWVLPLAGWALSILAFLPMAWLKHFDHYHYWPMAMRAIFVASMIEIGTRALVSAGSRRAIQAPPRPDPAPGSLRRP